MSNARETITTTTAALERVELALLPYASLLTLLLRNLLTGIAL